MLGAVLMSEILTTVRAVSSAAMPGRLSGPPAWVGSHIGDLLLETDGATKSIPAFIPKDLSRIQYVGHLATEAATVARASAGTTHVAQAALKDARTGAWHVSSLVDEHGSQIRFDTHGALEQTWDDASLAVRHQDLGAVYGETTEFPVKDEMLEAMIETPRVGRLDLPLVHTGEAKRALAAAQQGTTTNLAEIVGRSGSRASEGIARLEPLGSPPAALVESPVVTSHGWRHEQTETYIDAAKAYTINGPIDVAQRSARRLSTQLQGQEVGVLRNGQDSWIIAPLTSRSGRPHTYQRENSHHIDAVGDVMFGRREPTKGTYLEHASTAPELERLVTPDGIRTAQDEAIELLEPAALKRAMAELPVHERIRVLEQEQATVREQLADAGWFRRGSLERSDARLESTLAGLREERRQSIDGMLSKIGPHLLSEFDEWAARGVRRSLRNVTEQPADLTYEAVVNLARRDSQSSAKHGTVVIEGIDGRLWTGTLDVTPNELRVGHGNDNGPVRFSESVRAVSVGGRTAQWDAAGAATIN